MAAPAPMRFGWTTGACATAAAVAAYTALRTGEFPDPVTIILPKGQTPAFALTRHGSNGPSAWATVTKDAGDDPDVTHGALITSTLTPLAPGSGIRFAAGEGVGMVTKPGLPLEVGEPAINPVPRRMIRENLAAAAEALGGTLDLQVEIAVANGARIAQQTWNPRLGIIGGLSILGTTGIVIPYSCSAWIDSIRRGIDVARATGLRHVGAATGTTSEETLMRRYGLDEGAMLDMGDFAGAVLKYLRGHPVEHLSVGGGFAKMSKLAAGHLDLHSGRTSIDLGAIAAYVDDPALRSAVERATSALHAWQLADAAGYPLADRVAEGALRTCQDVLQDAPVAVDVVVIDRAGTIIGTAGEPPTG